MIGNIMSRVSTDSVEAVKMAIDSMKIQGETVLKLIDEQKQVTKGSCNPEGIGETLDVYA